MWQWSDDNILDVSFIFSLLLEKNLENTLSSIIKWDIKYVHGMRWNTVNKLRTAVYK